MDRLSKFSASQPYNPGTATQGKDIQPDKDLRTHWKNPYLGSACVRLRDTVQNYQQKSSPEFYSKTIYLLQSSGAGKSRMAHKYGNMVPMVTFVIRDPTNSGFPPSDEPVFNFLRSHPNSMDRKQLEKYPRSRESATETIKDRAIWLHALAIGILQATFEQRMFLPVALLISDWNRLPGSEKITEWNPINSYSAVLAWNFQIFLGNVNSPSPRAEFYEKIVNSAKDISVSCVADPSFRQLFDNQEGSIRKKPEESQCQPLRQFRAAFEDLQEDVKPWRQAFENENDPLFTLVFDEVDSLMNDAENERFIALNRIISALSPKHNIWFLFLSTNSGLDNKFCPLIVP